MSEVSKPHSEHLNVGVEYRGGEKALWVQKSDGEWIALADLFEQLEAQREAAYQDAMDAFQMWQMGNQPFRECLLRTQKRRGSSPASEPEEDA